MKLITSLICSVALAAAPVLADGKGKDKKHGQKVRVEQSYHGDAKGRNKARRAAVFCPPGLAKKHNGCQPPGQAKKAERHNDHDRYHDHDDVRLHHGDFHVGQYLTLPTYHLVRDPQRYGVPYLHDGSRYAIADQRLLRIDPATLEILAVLSIVQAILD